jgi:hypothetical protein
MTTRVLAVLIMMTVLPNVSSGSGQAGQEKLGRVEFPTSCRPAVQPDFNRAVAMLHSFWFEAAATAFGAVAAADGTCGMAHWGRAMTALGNPFAWPPSPKAVAEGASALAQAQAAGVKTPRERDYLAALATFYQDAERVEHRARAVAYATAMEELAARYPDDREAAIFYALALNATALPSDKTYGNQRKAAAILEEAFRGQPNHPGVAHYLIHSYDYPPIAAQGLYAARRYATIAPSAPHALHMPSHIFTRRGFWGESIASNRASAAAAKNDFDRLHALDYLMYAHLQGAQDQAAKGVLDEVARIQKVTMEHFVPAYALAAIPTRYALERGRWAELTALALAPADFPWARFPQAEAILQFGRAIGGARGGDLSTARQSVARLQALREGLLAAKSAYWAEQVDIQHRAASGLLAHAEGRNAEAVDLLRAAAELEARTEKHPVTPGPIVPARELLAELLLALNQPDLALREFEATLQVEPNRFRTLHGAARAAELAGDREAARRYYETLLAQVADADTERPELHRARTLLGRATR